MGLPNLLVPLTRADATLKVELLLKHFESQASRTWFRSDTFHGLMGVRAIECNAAEGRAEAFYVRKLVVQGGHCGTILAMMIRTRPAGGAGV